MGLYWAYQELPELGNQTGWVEVDDEIAAVMIGWGELEDGRLGGLYMTRIGEAPEGIKRNKAGIYSTRQMKAQGDDDDQKLPRGAPRPPAESIVADSPSRKPPAAKDDKEDKTLRLPPSIKGEKPADPPADKGKSDEKPPAKGSGTSKPHKR